MRVLRTDGVDAVGIDVLQGPFTDHVGSISDPETVARAMDGVDTVVHTATLHKPHVATHPKSAFVETNIAGTLALLEAAVAVGVRAFVFTSTTSTFGRSLSPPAGAPAVWIEASVPCVPKNIYGVTKTAAEDLCQLFHHRHRLPCVVLRTSRFFPEVDDSRAVREAFADGNAKANEFLFRRIDLADVVSAHRAAIRAAADVGFDTFVVSATTPFNRDDAAELAVDAPSVVARRVPGFSDVYRERNYRMFPTIGRVYDNARARALLGWQPRFDFATIVEQLSAGVAIGSPLARVVGTKGYHDEIFEDGPFPVD